MMCSCWQGVLWYCAAPAESYCWPDVHVHDYILPLLSFRFSIPIRCRNICSWQNQTKELKLLILCIHSKSRSSRCSLTECQALTSAAIQDVLSVPNKCASKSSIASHVVQHEHPHRSQSSKISTVLTLCLHEAICMLIWLLHTLLGIQIYSPSWDCNQSIEN